MSGSVLAVRRLASRRLPHASANLVCLLAALGLSLYVLCRSNPFYVPAIDDSAIVMRYLRNFQAGCFYCYNVQDGPVYGISGFWHGVAAGTLAWLGLAPLASLMTVAFVACTLFFNAVFRLFHHVSRNLALAIAAGFAFYFSTRFIPINMFDGLEPPLHLWLIATTFLLFFQDRQRLFYLLAWACIVSKLDSSFLIAFMLSLNLLRAHLAGRLRRAVLDGVVFFGGPMVAWVVFATLVFGSPIPQSFLSKFLLRPHAPRTSWFPFIEPMLDGHEAKDSLLPIGLSICLAGLVAWARRAWFAPSIVFAAAAFGTLGLYFVYNPGERMSWYYGLPEFLVLMAVFVVPFDAARLARRRVAIPASLLGAALAVSVLWIRFPLNQWIIGADRATTTAIEQDRIASGELANAVAPKDHPVLWTGHGYPAYLFDGYVVDYSALNFRGMWRAVKAVKQSKPDTRAFLTSIGLDPDANKTRADIGYLAEFELIDLYKPTVFMQHTIFNDTLQRTLNLRLAGSFYMIDLFGAPAFRVFVADPGHAELNHAIGAQDITASGGGPTQGPVAFTGTTLTIALPPRTSRLLMGVYEQPQRSTLELADAASGRAIGQCSAPANPPPPHEEAIYPCEIEVTPQDAAEPVTLRPTDASGPMRIFEPVATEYLGSPVQRRLAQR